MVPRHGWPEPRLEQWHCIAALSAAMALPRKLEKVAKVLGLSYEQRLVDHNIMRQLETPRDIREIPCALCGAGGGQQPTSSDCRCGRDPRCRADLVWLEDPEIIERGTDHCIRALELLRELHVRLQPLPPFERQIWLLDQRINERGVSVDVDLVRKEHRIVEDRLKALNARLSDITEGAVSSATQIAKLLAWLRSNGVTPPGGAESNKLGKEEIRSLLKCNLPDKCRHALEIRAEAAKTSTAKLDAFIKRTSADGRLRDSLVYRGAGRTGRWSGRGAQLQNLPRPPANFTSSDIKWALELIRQGWRIEDIGQLVPAQGLDIITACLRPLLIAAPGHDLIAADYNAIEARGVAWLAGADRMLGIFARGEDPYLDMAAQIFGVSVERLRKVGPERQLGKAAVLGLGYQMGAATFRETCEKQSVAVTDDLIKRAVRIYREMNPEIRDLWRELEGAAIEAVRNEGRPVWCARGRIAFGKRGNWLVMRLPSGRFLWYYEPHLRERAVPWDTTDGEPNRQVGVSFYGQDEQHKWRLQDGYGGRWVENAVSGFCRDLLANSMLNLEAAGYEIVLSVHDEVIAEVPEKFGNVAEFEEIMCRLPDWAAGFPVKAEGWREKRFQ
jgi:DNA polymerase